eukprot:721335-Ditylum_brightwellii.AAC.1
MQTTWRKPSSFDCALVEIPIVYPALQKEKGSGLVLGLGYGLSLNKGQEFKWDTTLVFDLGIGLGSNLSFVLGCGLRTSM